MTHQQESLMGYYVAVILLCGTLVWRFWTISLSTYYLLLVSFFLLVPGGLNWLAWQEFY